MTFLTDLRFGARMLSRTPTATLAVVLALSLGIGLSAVTFATIDGALLTRLPGEGGDRIVRIGHADGAPTAVDEYAHWVARQRTFDGIGAVEMSTVTLAMEGWAAEPVASAAVSPSLLPLVSAEPVLGRSFTERDAAPGAPAVALVSHAVWRDRMGSDPAAVGRVVRVNGRPTEVVGVLDEGFGFPWFSELWTPFDVDPLRHGDVAFSGGEDRLIIGRLREGVAPGVAAEELARLSLELDAAPTGGSGAGARVSVREFTDMFGEPGASELLAGLMLGIAFLVLLVACGNVANVLLARAIDRAREVAVRTAMGASRRRIVGQLLAEVSLLAAGGAAGGVAIAYVGVGWIESSFPPGMPYWIHLRVDGSALVFSTALAVVTALAAGLVPALRASRANTHDLLKDTSRGSSGRAGGKLMGRLVGIEMALSFVLIVLAGLFVKSADFLRDAEYAFEPRRVSMANLTMPGSSFATGADLARFADELLAAVDALPEVEGVALATAPPGIGSSGVMEVEIDGGNPDEEGAGRVRRIVVSPGYFELFHAAPVAGRAFDAGDVEGVGPVAVVNRPFVEKYFPDGEALDRRVRLRGGSEPGEWVTVVGVVPDLLAGGREAQVPEVVYRPFAQNPVTGAIVLASTTGDVSMLPGPIREAVASLDPDVAVFRAQTLDDAIDAANSSSHWISLLFLVSGAVALFLATIGLYGVMAFWVIQRSREIGVRMALGGQRADVVRLVLGQGMRHAGIGLAVGALIALPVARLFASALFGVRPYDPVVFGTTMGVLGGVALLGCLLPARRATGLEPMDALASE